MSGTTIVERFIGILRDLVANDTFWLGSADVREGLLRLPLLVVNEEMQMRAAGGG